MKIVYRYLNQIYTAELFDINSNTALEFLQLRSRMHRAGRVTCRTLSTNNFHRTSLGMIAPMDSSAR